MANYGYLARIGVDTSGLQTGLREVDSQIRQTDTEINQINRSLRQAQQSGTDATEIMAQRQQVLNQQYQQTTQRLEQLRSVTEQMNRGLNNGTIDAEAYRTWQREISNTTARLQQLQNQMDDTSEEGNQLSSAFGDMLKAEVVAKAIETLVSALVQCGEAIVDVCKESAQLSAQWEQLEGGVETLFGKLDAKTVFEDAANAYNTAGMSANAYAQMAIQASSKLKKSLNDDTKATAEYIQKQATQISDIVNKLGVEMGSVSYAYQGFTRDNFTMLDNLALGYAGTKEGMKELLSDAEKLSGMSYDISKYTDILDAIQVIIEKQGIAGTTQLESLTTLEGAMKRFENQIENIKTQLGGQFRDVITQFFNLMNEHTDEINELAKVLGDKVNDILTELFNHIKKFVENGGIEKIEDVIVFFIDNAEEIIVALTTITALMNYDKVTKFVDGIKGLSTQFNTLSTTLGAATSSASGMTSALVAAAPELIAVTVAAVALSTALNEQTEAWRKAAKAHNEYVDSFQKTYNNDDVRELIGKDDGRAKSEAKSRIAEQEKTLKALQLRKAQIDAINEDLADGIWDSTDMSLEEANKFLLDNADIDFEISTLKGSIYELNGIIEEVDTRVAETLTESGKRAEAETKARFMSAEDSGAKLLEGLEEKYKEFKKNLDHQLATHQISEAEYYQKKQEYLNGRKGLMADSELWHKENDAVTEYYEKLSESEKKAIEKAQKEAETAAKEAAKKKYEALERQRDESEDDEYNDKWFVEQLGEMVKSLEEGTDLYYEYYDKWISAKNKLEAEDRKTIEENAKKDADTWKKASEKVSDAVKKRYEDVEKNFEKANSEFVGALNLMEDSTSKATEDVIPSWGKINPAINSQLDSESDKSKRKLADIKAQNDELKKYQKELNALKNTGISDEHMANIMSMSLSDREEYVSALMGMSERERKKYFAEYEEYLKTSEELANESVENELEEADRYAEAATKVISDAYDSLSEEAKKKGEATATAFLEGISQVMNDTKSDLLSGALLGSDYKHSNMQIAESMAKTYADVAGGSVASSGNTIVVYLDGKEAFKQAITENNTQINLSGGMVGG